MVFSTSKGFAWQGVYISDSFHAGIIYFFDSGVGATKGMMNKNLTGLSDILLAMVVLGGTWGCTSGKVHVDRQLIPIHVSGKWGYADRNAHVIVQPKYDRAYDFVDGVARVEVNKKWGLIDRTGKEIASTTYDEFGGLDVENKIMSFCVGDCEWQSNNGRWGFLRYTDGKVVVHAKYGDAGTFSEGLGPVCVGSCHDHEEGEFGKDYRTVKATGKWGYVDQDGREVIAPQFDSAGPFVSGLAAVALGRGDSARDGFIDKRGAFIVGPSN